MMMMNARHALACALLALPAWAQAGELYSGIGFPGVGLGWAQPVGDAFALRADVYTVGNHEDDKTESDIAYHGKLKLNRGGLFADWFAFAGSFRLTGGVTFNNFKLLLDATGANGRLTIGDRTYNTTAADGLAVDIKFPSTTPYLGFGWGHHAGSGWRFSADIGASIGRAKLTATPRGQLASQPDIQANIDKELADLRDGVGKVKAFPQLTLGLGYSF